MSDPLLETAYRISCEAGFREATTRHIAAEAGINEVTLFRRCSSGVLVEPWRDRRGRPC